MSDDEDEARRSGIPLWVGLLIGFLVGLPVLAVLAALVAVVLIVALSVVGNNLSQEFNYIGSTIGSQPVVIRPHVDYEVEVEAAEEEAPKEGQEVADAVKPAEGGLKVGASILEVQAVNGKAFKIYGFEIDSYLAGSIMSWEGGELSGEFAQFEYTKPTDKFDFDAIIGDMGLVSDNPILTAAGLQVVRLEEMSRREE